MILLALLVMPLLLGSMKVAIGTLRLINRIKGNEVIR